MSPKRDRNAHTSSIFPYSTARPPTNYSAQSWLPQNPQPPPVPTSTDSRVPADENPFGGMEEEEEELEDPRETPLYARSDWEGDQETGPISGTGTAWSRSSFAGMTTAAPTAAFGGLEEIREVHDEEEELIVEDPAHAGRILSPERPISTGMRQRLTGHASEASLPSVIDLEDLKLSSAVANPFADPVVEPNRRRTSYLPEPTPNLQIERASPDFMSPAAHEKLGRMSVAPARYTLPPVQRDVSTNGSGDQASSLSLPVSFGSKAHQYFYTYRPFINTLLSFICVIFLTLAVQTSGTVSTIVIVQPGAFSVDAANGATVGLGAFGWCQRGVNKQVCWMSSLSSLKLNGEIAQRVERILMVISRILTRA